MNADLIAKVMPYLVEVMLVAFFVGSMKYIVIHGKANDMPWISILLSAPILAILAVIVLPAWAAEQIILKMMRRP